MTATQPDPAPKPRRTLSVPLVREHDLPDLLPASPEVRARQRRLWLLLLQARYAGIAGMILLSLVPSDGRSRLWLTAGLIGFVLPYNGIHDYVLRRRDRLLPTMAFGDQVVVVAGAAISPEILPGVAVTLVAVNATAAVAFGRRLAAIAAAIGLSGIACIVAIARPPDGVTTTLVCALASAFLIVVVGGVAQMERDLRERYVELMGGIDAIVWEQLTSRPSTLYVSGGAEQVLGYDRSTWARPGSWSEHVHPDDRAAARAAYRDALGRGRGIDLEYRMIAADGRVVHVHDRMRVETDDGGRPVKVRGVMIDVTAARLAEQRANQFVDLVENIRLALFVLELVPGPGPGPDELRVLAVNPAASELTGIDPLTAVGAAFGAVMHLPEDHDVVERHLADVVRSGESWSNDRFRIPGPSNAHRTFSLSAFPLPGRAVGLALHDITERSMAAEVLRRQALHDALTGLPNRIQLRERIQFALDARESGPAPGAPGADRVALLMMDVNQFKDVNDALGHAHGDRLLIELSRRLQRTVREADTIARLGGDEFAVLLRDVADAEAALAYAERVRAALDEPFQIGGITVQAGAPIGIALFPDHASDPEMLIQHADVAMYVAKRGGTGVAVYAPELDSSSVKRITLVAQLRKAIHDGELVLHFQPSLDLRSGEVHGAEALVRWQHPEFGLMAPGEFIELAEVSGAIAPLTRWVIDAVLRQQRVWCDDARRLHIGCNISVRNLQDKDLVAWLDERLTHAGTDPALLKLEVTESELMDDPNQAREVLGQLKALGVETSIDDFGTGYSSLAYLKSLPIDELKIDKSFVDHLTTEGHDLAIVRSTIDLSHNLGLSVTAEGVEDAGTLTRLAELGCDRAQGYFVSRPLPPSAFEAWLDDPAIQDALRACVT